MRSSVLLAAIVVGCSGNVTPEPAVETPDTAEPVDTSTPAMDSAAVDTAPDTAIDTSGACPTSSGCVLKVPIPTTTFVVMSTTFTVCPEGAKPSASPPECILEIDLSAVPWTFTAGDGATNLTGAIPMRVASLPVKSSLTMSTFPSALGDGSGCPASTFADIPTKVAMTSSSSSPRPGCDPGTAKLVVLNANDLKDHTRACGPSAGVLPVRDGIVAAINAQAEKALRDATSSVACRAM